MTTQKTAAGGETIEERLAAQDPDRRMAALFAPAEIRARLLALYAFNHEIARISETVSEALIADMRLTWWREAVEALCAPAPKVRRHDVAEALAPFAATIGAEALTGLIEARRIEAEPRALADVDACIAHADAAAGALIDIADRLAGGEADASLRRDAGRAWGLTGLLRAHPHRRAAGRPLLADGVIAPLRAAASEAVSTLKGRGFPAESFPALGYVALASGYLKRLPSDPAAPEAPRSPLLRQFRLLGASLSGRF